MLFSRTYLVRIISKLRNRNGLCSNLSVSIHVLDIERGLVINIEQSNTVNTFGLWLKIKLNDSAVDVLEWTETKCQMWIGKSTRKARRQLTCDIHLVLTSSGISG